MLFLLAHDGPAPGDPRRCPCHPHVVISSPDGLHDTLCGLCEVGMELDEADEAGPVHQPHLPAPTIDDDLPF